MKRVHRHRVESGSALLVPELLLKQFPLELGLYLVELLLELKLKLLFERLDSVEVLPMNIAFLFGQVLVRTARRFFKVDVVSHLSISFFRRH